MRNFQVCFNCKSHWKSFITTFLERCWYTHNGVFLAESIAHWGTITITCYHMVDVITENKYLYYQLYLHAVVESSLLEKNMLLQCDTVVSPSESSHNYWGSWPRKLHTERSCCHYSSTSPQLWSPRCHFDYGSALSNSRKYLFWVVPLNATYMGGSPLILQW